MYSVFYLDTYPLAKYVFLDDVFAGTRNKCARGSKTMGTKFKIGTSERIATGDNERK